MEAFLKFLVPLAMLLALVGCTGNGVGDIVTNNETQPEGQVISPDHPNLFFDNSDLSTLRDKISEEPCKFWWQTIKNDADHALEIDFLNSSMTQAGRAHYAHYLAFAYLLTDHSEYAEKCTELLLTAQPEKVAPDLRIDYLHTTDTLNRYVMSYDWTIDSELVSASQRETIEANISAVADYLYQYLKIPLEDWRSAKGNERIRADAALGLAALALADQSDNTIVADEWLEFTLDDLFGSEGHIARTITSDGAFIEGPSYGDYSFEELLPFAHAYQRLDSIDLLADTRIQNYFDWQVKTRMPDGSAPTFDTGWRFPLNLQMVVAGDYENSETYMWDWERSRNAVSSSTYTYPLTQYIIYYDSSIKAREPAWPPTQYFPEGGMAVFQSDWSGNATYLLLLAEHTPNISTHEQPDQSSFILYAKNTYLAIDPGDGRHYEDGETQNWIRSAQAHNLILVDGEGPGIINDYKKVKDPAYLRDYFTTKDIDYAEVEVSYASINLSRKVLFPQHEYFIVADDIKSDSTHQYDFRLHFGDANTGNLSVKDNAVEWEILNDRGENAQLSVILNASTGRLDISSHRGPTDYNQDGYTFEHDYIDAETSGKDVSFLTILFPALKAEELPILEKVYTSAGQAILLTSGNRDDLIYMGDSTEMFEMTPIKSQAQLMFASLTGGDLNYFSVAHGRSFSYHERQLFQSVEPASVSLSYGDSVIEGVVRLENNTEVYLFVEGLRAVWLNGKELKSEQYRYEGGTGILTLNLTHVKPARRYE